MMQLKKNFLKSPAFVELTNIITDKKFPWYFTQSPGEPEQYTNILYYDHEYSKDVTPKLKRILAKICTQLGAISVLRIKVNSTPRNGGEQIWHTDWQLSTPSKTCVLYLNTNNGYTQFDPPQELPFGSEQNSAVIFDTNLVHRGVPAQDVSRRLVMNINYFEK